MATVSLVSVKNDVADLTGAVEDTNELFLSTLSEVSTTNITLDEGHFKGNVILKCMADGNATITVPSGLTVSQPVIILRYNLGNVDIIAGENVSLLHSNGPTYNRLRAQYSTAILIPVGEDEYILDGDLRETE